jgi:hypothetical protein
MEGSVERFAILAEEYCDVIEQLADLSDQAFVQAVVRLIPALYLAALDLQVVSSGDADLIDGAKDSGVEHLAVDARISDKLGQLDFYWEVFDPYEEGAPVCGSIGDDLADIYGDLKNALDLYRRGGEAGQRKAVWHWRFTFLFHWGDHLVDALRALHRVHTNRLKDDVIDGTDSPRQRPEPID